MGHCSGGFEQGFKTEAGCRFFVQSTRASKHQKQLWSKTQNFLWPSCFEIEAGSWLVFLYAVFLGISLPPKESKTQFFLWAVILVFWDGSWLAVFVQSPRAADYTKESKTQFFLWAVILVFWDGSWLAVFVQSPRAADYTKESKTQFFLCGPLLWGFETKAGQRFFV